MTNQKKKKLIACTRKAWDEASKAFYVNQWKDTMFWYSNPNGPRALTSKTPTKTQCFDIQAIPINLTSTLGDTTAWALLRDGNFNLASAYLLAKGLNALNLPTFTSNWIWKMKVPQKIIIFLWLCSHNSVPVREVLGSRGLTLDQACPFCHSQVESINHLLRYCPFAVSFWN